MPRYSIRFYSSYVDEYEVEADSADEARELAEEYECYINSPTETAQVFLATYGPQIEVVAKHEYVDSEHPCINELDADGNWIDA